MRILFTCILFISCFVFRSSAQGLIELNPEERAYLFHIVKKSPILDNSIGRYFEYNGPDIRFMNKEINYDSVETIIINNPAVLNIRTSEIGKSPQGIIAEAANKMALWELNKVLLASRQGEKDLERYLPKFNEFNGYLMEKLPESAIKRTDEGNEPQKKIQALINPSLNFQDKNAMVASFNFLNEQEQLQTLEAISYAINTYVEKRAYEIYLALGGIATKFDSRLIAAGDGSDTSGLLNEREKDENGRWNKGLPKAVGLFPYEVKLKPVEKRDKTNLDALMFPTMDFETVGNNKLTQLHFDVWGYNSNKQTTVVVERNGLSYHLFGSDETRFLSPDSTFSSGGTFMTVINALEHGKIADLEEKIYGKKGYEFQIKEAEEGRDDTKLKIMKEEKEYSDLHQNTITTSDRVPRSVKKKRRKADMGTSGSNTRPQPITHSKGKPKRGSENDIVFLYDKLAYYEKLIRELEIEKAAAIDLLAVYRLRLNEYKQAIGTRWATFEEKDGLYIFEDSTTFDLLTQEFTFKEDTIQRGFEVRLVSIPFSPLSNEADEVMLHVSLTDAKPDFDARLHLQLNDVFESNKWELKQPLLKQEDSLSVRMFFESLLVKKPEFEALGRGNGVGEWNGVQTVRAKERAEWAAYGTIGKMDSSMIRLRSTEVNIFLNRGTLLEVDTYTDPVKTNLTAKNTEIQEQLNRYKLTGNDYLSAMRTAVVIAQLKKELNVLAGTYLSREQATVVIDRMNKVIDGMRVAVGQTSFSWQELLSN